MLLTECHGHVLMDGADYRKALARHRDGADEAYVRTVLEALSAAGVAYFREGGDPLGVSSSAARLAPEYGIEYANPCFAIHRKGRYGAVAGRSYSDMEEYRALLERLKREGADFVKLIVTGIMTFRSYGELSCGSLPAEEIRELIHIAKGEGFPVMVHANGRDAVEACAEADSVEHGYFMEEETLHLLAESGTVWVPTLAAVDAFREREGFGGETASRTLERQKETLLRAEELGVPIGCGSDSGAFGVPHGDGTRRELSLLLEAGLEEETVEKGSAEIRRRFPGHG